MLTLLKRLFAQRPVDWHEVVHDEVLGELRLSDDADWWESEPVAAAGGIRFRVDGRGQPGAELMVRARQMVNGYAQLRRGVEAFLRDEVKRRESSRSPELAEEVRALQIESISLLDEKRPELGMIYFTGPDEYRIWRCDFVDGVPRDLGFDS